MFVFIFVYSFWVLSLMMNENAPFNPLSPNTLGSPFAVKVSQLVINPTRFTQFTTYNNLEPCLLGSRVMEGEAQRVGEVVPGCESIEAKLPLI